MTNFYNLEMIIAVGCRDFRQPTENGAIKGKIQEIIAKLQKNISIKRK